MHIFNAVMQMLCFRYMLLVLFFTLALNRAEADGIKSMRDMEKKIMNEIFNFNNDPRIRPCGANRTDVDAPVVNRINLFVRSIEKLDDVKMEFIVQLTFRQEWLDERLRYDSQQGRIKYITVTDTSRLWTPDVFFTNEKRSHKHDLMTPNVMVRIFPDGAVLYSSRISLTLACPMDTQLYPMDSQTCSIRIPSYAFNTDDLVLIWKEYEPVQLVKNLQLLRFTLEKFEVDYCTSKTNTGEYSCLKVDFFFKREFGQYLRSIYLPYALLVVLSWTVFWFDQSALLAQVLIGATSLTVMTVLGLIISIVLPSPPSSNAADAWSGACWGFVMAVMFEIVLVHYVYRLEKTTTKKYRELHQIAGQQTACEDIAINNDDTPKESGQRHMESSSQTALRKRCAWTSCPRAAHIHVTARIMFPIAFILYNMVYWTRLSYGNIRSENV